MSGADAQRDGAQRDGALDGLGPRLRDLRHARGLSLSDLGAASGVPPSSISKIENGQMNPSLVHAINLAQALEANLGFLLHRNAAPDVAFAVVRGDRRARMDLPEMSLSLQDLHGGFTPGLLEARLGILAPQASSGDEPMEHPGDEICHVLEGAIRYVVNGRHHDLAAGDSIHFKCADPHAWTNIHDGTTRVLWVFSEQLSF